MNINLLSAWNLIKQLPENEIKNKSNHERVQLFNHAIAYLKNDYHKLIDSSSLIEKFFHCIPAECAKHSDLHTLLSSVHNDGNFHEKTLWNHIFGGQTTHLALEKALEDLILSGNEEMAIAFLEHQFPVSKKMLLLAYRCNCENVVLYLIENSGVAQKMEDYELEEFFKITSERNQIKAFNAMTKVHPLPVKILNKIIRPDNELQLVELIEKGTTFNDKTLVRACEGHLCKLMSCLIEKGAAIPLATGCGKSPLYLACQEKDPKLARVLIKRGVMFNEMEELEFKNKIINIDFLEEKERIEFAKIYLSINRFNSVNDLRNYFGLKDEKDLIEVIKFYLTQNFKNAIQLFKEINFNDEKILIDIARFYAKFDGYSTMHYYEQFGIKNISAIHEIFKLIFFQNGINIFLNKEDFQIKILSDVLHLENLNEELKELILKFDLYNFHVFIKNSLQEHFPKELEIFGLTQKVNELDKINEEEVKKSLCYILEILMLSKISLNKEFEVEKKEFLAEISTFGRNDLTAPLMRKVLFSWNEPDYIRAAELTPKMELPWKHLLRASLVELKLKGIKHETIIHFFNEIKNKQDFRDGKKVQIIIDMLIQLVKNDELTALECDEILSRIIKEGQMSTQKSAYLKSIKEGEEALQILEHARKTDKQLKNKLIQDCERKIQIFEKAKKEGIGVPSQKELGSAYLINSSAVIGTLGFKNGAKILQRGDLTLNEALETAFKLELPLGFIDDFAKKYHEKFIESRNPFAFITYISKVTSLNNPESMYCLIQYLTSVLNGNFLEMRYSLKNNLHLSTINKADHTLIDRWKNLLPASKIENLETAKDEIGISDWITDILLKNKSLELDYLEKFFNNFDSNNKKEIRDECFNKWEKIKNIKLSINDAEPKVQKNRVLLQKQLFEFMEEKNPQKKLGLIRLIKGLLEKDNQFSNIKFIDNIEEKLKSLKEVQKEMYILESNDPIDFLLCGTEVNNSCQSIYGCADFNVCLLGYMMNGKNHLIVIKDSAGKIVARTLLRLLLKDGKTPVLYRDRLYINSDYKRYKQVINEFAINKAKSLNIPVYYCEDFEIDDSIALESLKGPAPWEYCDKVGKIKNGEFKIFNCSLLKVNTGRL